jgi:hypothetical protein
MHFRAKKTPSKLDVYFLIYHVFVEFDPRWWGAQKPCEVQGFIDIWPVFDYTLSGGSTRQVPARFQKPGF